jgi:acetyltransferase-like isoleucine patch superfamily enzyme
MAPLLFEQKYLTGRPFIEGVDGWYWVQRSILTQRVLSYNRHIPWPVSPFMTISNPANIDFDPDDLINFQQFGCYFQNFAARISIGKGTRIAANVGIITANHDTQDPSTHSTGEDVVIGRNCWIGMNAVILPGVVLGEHSVVGAGSVVTKSFSDGYVVLAGAPAKPIRQLR